MALRAAWVADMNERIGRLPSVALLTPPGPTTAWHIAQHLVGDDPSQIVATVQDLVRRNGLRHPALIPAGTVLEVLVR